MGGVIVWIVNDRTINYSETGTSFKQALYFKEIGFNLHDTMIWNKGSFTDISGLRTRYGSVFEYMFIITKGKIKTFNPIKDRKNKYTRVGNGTIRLSNGKFKKQWGAGRILADYGIRFNIWNNPSICSKIERTGHPAQFPLKLVNDHIISWSNENDIVLDPFMGSGTTGEAALKLNRKFIGIEKVESYFEIARKRIEGINEKPS